MIFCWINMTLLYNFASFFNMCNTRKDIPLCHSFIFHQRVQPKCFCCVGALAFFAIDHSGGCSAGYVCPARPLLQRQQEGERCRADSSIRAVAKHSMRCIVMCTNLWQILTGGETKMLYCREDLSERGVETELCKPLKLWWRSEELIRTEWTIQTRRTQSVMQKVSPRMTPLTRITGWVYRT